MTSFHPKPFGKYFLIEKLATGGMAEIYKAKTFGVDGFEKLLAIKRILPHCSADKEFISMLIDEAKLSVLLSHTNIVQVYDLGKVGEDYFISMEFINGVNLRELLNRIKEKDEALSEELVVYIMSEVCKGLDYAHSKRDSEGKELNIVHRDVSPQNILLSFEGEVKIVDFGIAKAAMNISHTMAGILKGKISYMSPEQALGKTIDRKTDIFSAGLMLYELLTGDKLFKGETQFEVLKKIRTTRLTEKSFPETMSEPIRKVLAKALAYSTKERYDTAGDFQIDLTRYLYTTHADFTPRKLSNSMRQLFASEIETKKAHEAEDAQIEPQTQSIVASGQNQEEIVHRERTPTKAPGQQPTKTFMESQVEGRETEAEPSITKSKQLLDQEATPTPLPGQAPTQPKPVPQKAAKKGWKKLLYPIAALLLIGAGLGAYYKTDWFRAPPAPKLTGVLQINSNPEKAAIFINGEEQKQTTPATLEKMELGKALKITLKKPRHKEWTKTLKLKDENPVTLNPTLEVIPVGSIQVTSKPEGAKILLDNKDTEKVTPTTLEDLPLSKTYAVRLELEGYQPLEKPVTVYSIEPIEFQEELKKILYGSLRVASTPSGARVYLNNSDTGKNTPTTLPKLEVGKRYTIKLTKKDYRPVTRSVGIEKEGTKNIRERLAKVEEQPKTTDVVKDQLKNAEDKIQELEAKRRKEQEEIARKKREAEERRKREEQAKEQPAAKVAYVSVSTNPKGADVFINSVKKGRTPGRYQVNPGTPVEITASKDGATVTRVVTLRPGETRSLSLKLKSTSGKGKGEIVIDSNTPGLQVYVNGQAKGRTPIRVKNLRPGRTYNFEVKKGGKSWKRSVTAGEGSKSFMVNL